MELKWWPVILAGLATLAAAGVLAWALPTPTTRRQLRPLAHVDRLTRLPEYVRVYRAYFLSMLVTLVLLLLTFGAALVASARPTGLPASTEAFDAAYPQDTMLCVGQEVTDPTTAKFLTYYAQQAQSFDKQRLGLTSSTLRVIPLTRDHTYVSDRLQGLARLAPIQQNLNADEPVTDADRAELEARAAEFSRPIDYVDFARSVEDVLALCLTGFQDPESGSQDARRRQLIYLGYSALRDPADQRAALYSTEAVKQLAAETGVQINVISRADVVESTSQGNDSLRSIAEGSGGRFQLYNPAETELADPGIDPILRQYLDQIQDNPPSAELPDGRIITSSSWDTPDPVLVAGVVAVALLSLSLMVLRR